MKRIKILLPVVMALLSLQSFATITLPRLVSNDMVLQRDVALPVWGFGAVGESVTVNFNGNNYNAVTAADGKWTVTLSPTTGGTTEYTMTITGSNVVTVTGIVMGDVFLCGGQSNMAHIMNTSASIYANEINTSFNNYIRHFKVKRKYSSTNLDDVESVSGWQKTTPLTVLNFTAVGYFFARDLYAKYGIPVGLLNSSYEGTPAQAWMSQDGLTAFPQYTTFTPNTTNPEYDPSVCYKAMINPLLTTKFKSILWYQGESNRLKSYEYRTLFPALMLNWRNKLNQGTLPFLFVQLHNYLAENPVPEEANTAECREAQTYALAQPLTAMAIAMDTNTDTVTHPLEKQPVGIRLSLAAQNVVYGDNSVVYQGPTYQSYAVQGNKIVISFTNVGGGLVASGGALKHFAIAGADRKFRFATATIVGNTIEVYNDTIQKPVAVRYGWAYNPMGVNLYNTNGLPAAPFRTDQWAGTTYVAPAIASTLASNFTPGNLVAYRYGTGTAALSTSTVPVFVDEFLTQASVAPVQSLAIPTTTVGANARLVGMPKSGATYLVEGMPALSQDGQLLTIYGHDAAVGATSVASGERTVGIIDLAGNINTQTKFSNTGMSARTAIVDNTTIWASGFTAGVVRNTLNAAASSQTTVNAATPGASRSFTIFKNRMYAAGGNAIVYVFNSLPTGTGTATPANFTVAGSPLINQMAFLDLDGNNVADVMYVADDGGASTPGSAALRKYTSTNGTTWTAKGSITVTDTAIVYGLKGITARVVGNAAEIYANTWGNISVASETSVILKLVDNNIATSVIDKTNTAIEVIARADNNTQFRGITFTPGSTTVTTLPVSLINFSGYKNAGKVELKWNTATEISSDRFDVTRSVNGIDFTTIGSVQAHGNSNSNINYSFTDAAPLTGLSYYRLTQISKDGGKTNSGIVRIKDGKNTNSINVISTSGNNIGFAVNFDKNEKTTLVIIDASGRIIAKQNINLTKGNNNFTVNAYITGGTYVAAIQTTAGLLSVKFIKN